MLTKHDVDVADGLGAQMRCSPFHFDKTLRAPSEVPVLTGMVVEEQDSVARFVLIHPKWVISICLNRRFLDKGARGEAAACHLLLITRLSVVRLIVSYIVICS